MAFSNTLTRTIVLATICCSSVAFSPAVDLSSSRLVTKLYETDTLFDPESETLRNKDDVMKTASRLKEDYGTLLVDPRAQSQLETAVRALEDLSDPPENPDLLLGDWTLVCSTSSINKNTGSSESSNKKGSFLDNLPEPIEKIRKLIRDNANRYVTVRQVIRGGNEKKDDKGNKVERIDHVLEYEPPKLLQDLVKDLDIFRIPDSLTKLNINPLDITKSKVVLVHKASIESELPLVTKLALQSIVLNVAGRQSFLDPNGQDVLGLNLPLGEFINTGSFETTYMDKDLRISRGKLGGDRNFAVDQLRVFVRSDRWKQLQSLEEIVESPTKVGMGVDAEMDVDESEDPEFAAGDNGEETANGLSSHDDDPHEPIDSEEANSI